MKLLIDFFPIILFFITYHQAGAITENTAIGQLFDSSQPEIIVATMLATAVAIISSFIQVGGYWLKNRSVEKMHIFSLLLITILGGITIAFGDPAFIQWKPTVLNWVFAAAFLISQYVGKSSLVHRMMSSQISLPDAVWKRLNLSWVVFFIISGLANIYVAFYYAVELDEKTRMDTWVNFKLFGLLGLTVIFVIAQAFYLARYMTPEEDANQDGNNA
ncbi:MAG: septation protein A [Gammaproteobacteria bacterium]|nr:septation protein A [Gammaproteobacteria bacterium]